MWRNIAPAFRLTLVMTVLTGFIYPGVVTALCRALFARQSQGSLVVANGKIIGSELIGQSFARPEYFHPRPSAAGSGYDALASGGSNLGPRNPKLADSVGQSVAEFRAQNGYSGTIPADLVTASGSGLDPDISPAAAEVQVRRVALARGVAEDRVRQVVAAPVEGRTFGFLGDPRVNVLALNLDLDAKLAAAVSSRPEFRWRAVDDAMDSSAGAVSDAGLRPTGGK
jgi:K+-transporting ATPase ATPase C chain